VLAEAAAAAAAKAAVDVMYHLLCRRQSIVTASAQRVTTVSAVALSTSPASIFGRKLDL